MQNQFWLAFAAFNTIPLRSHCRKKEHHTIMQPWRNAEEFAFNNDVCKTLLQGLTTQDRSDELNYANECNNARADGVVVQHVDVDVQFIEEIHETIGNSWNTRVVCHINRITQSINQSINQFHQPLKHWSAANKNLPGTPIQNHFLFPVAARFFDVYF